MLYDSGHNLSSAKPDLMLRNASQIRIYLTEVGNCSDAVIALLNLPLIFVCDLTVFTQVLSICQFSMIYQYVKKVGD